MNNSGLSAPRPSAPHRSVTPTAPYSERAPSPPYITMQAMRRDRGEDNAHTIVPSVANLDALQLTREQLRIVTRDHAQTANDSAGTWMYEQRRRPQPVLDYMSIGPTSGIRDHDYLKENNITMIVVVQDARMANMGSLSVQKACEIFNLESFFVNVNIENPFHLIHELSDIVRTLTRHMINVHSQSQVTETGVPRTGHILVTCDSGNDRSAAVVAAYIMAVYGASMHKAAQFLHLQRFSCTFDEPTKRMLQTWEELLLAQAAVSADQQSTQHTTQPQKSKRGVDDMMASDMYAEAGAVRAASDEERFQERRFAPFRDTEANMQ